VSRRASLQVDVPVGAPQQAVWDAVTDWPRQSEWIIGTDVRVVEGDGRSVGSRIEAYTGKRPLGVLDTMTITAWEPPHRVVVLHDGRLLRGPGEIVVRADGERSVLSWSEDLELPFGVLGALGWQASKPLVRWGFRRSLRSLAESLERQGAHG